MEEKKQARLMRKTWIAGSVIVSPLGITTRENYLNIIRGVSGLRSVRDTSYGDTAIVASAMPDCLPTTGLSRFETLCSRAIEGLLQESKFPVSDSLLVLTSTKGNISFIEEGDPQHPRISLHATGAYLRRLYGFRDHVVVSNACISGVLGIIVAKRFLQVGKFDHVIVLGADSLSKFVVSGFRSLQALSDTPCRPFDAERNGINLGEAAGAVVLTSRPEVFSEKCRISVTGSGVSNDANHISGPSRTGEELSAAIKQALLEACLEVSDIDFVSSHGTATRFNDEMEAKALTLAGMKDTPVNSLKGYFGHTLGAAGIIESIISMESLLNNQLIPTKGYSVCGVTERINVVSDLISAPLDACIKTASGFGGCNAAVVLQKQNN
jgi:3-oxoacyl-[acyl-carrier-protein] synthase-1